MNEEKIRTLFRTAGKEAAPEVPFGFSQSVLRAIRRDILPARVSLSDQLSRLLPRVAFATVLVVSLCTAADYYLNDRSTTLTAAVEQVAADEWLVAGR